MPLSERELYDWLAGGPAVPSTTPSRRSIFYTDPLPEDAPGYQPRAIDRPFTDRLGDAWDDVTDALTWENAYDAWDTVMQPLKSAVGVTGSVGGYAGGKIAELAGDPGLRERALQSNLRNVVEPGRDPSWMELAEAQPGLGDIAVEATPDAWRETAVGQVVEPVARIAGNILGDPTTLVGAGIVGRALPKILPAARAGRYGEAAGHAAKAAAALPTSAAAGLAYGPEVVESTVGSARRAIEAVPEHGVFSKEFAVPAAQVLTMGTMGALMARGTAGEIGAFREARAGVRAPEPAAPDPIESALEDAGAHHSAAATAATRARIEARAIEQAARQEVETFTAPPDTFTPRADPFARSPATPAPAPVQPPRGPAAPSDEVVGPTRAERDATEVARLPEILPRDTDRTLQQRRAYYLRQRLVASADAVQAEMDARMAASAPPQAPLEPSRAPDAPMVPEAEIARPAAEDAAAPAVEPRAPAPDLVPDTPVDRVAPEAATAPDSPRPPTEAQIEAGNYRKGHARLIGLDLSIENPAGSTRSGVDPGGKPWSQEMRSHYGYIRGTKGKDKEHIDLFVRPGTPADYDGPVYVVNQKNAQGAFDEHKAVVGVGTEAEAREAYLENYQPGWDRIASIATFESPAAFKAWLQDGDTTKPAPAPVVAEVTPSVTPQIPERRVDAARRRTVADMAPEEMRQALLTDELTGLGNRRAYEEAPRQPVQVKLDVEGLKWANDNLGSGAGDEVLRAVGRAMREEGVSGYRMGGDEFLFEAADGGPAADVVRRVAERLGSSDIVATLPDGSQRTYRGFRLHHGAGGSFDEADAALNAAKHAAVGAGERAARGDRPRGLVEVAPERDPPQGDLAGRAGPQRDKTAAAVAAPEPAAAPVLRPRAAAERIRGTRFDQTTGRQVEVLGRQYKGQRAPAGEVWVRDGRKINRRSLDKLLEHDDQGHPVFPGEEHLSPEQRELLTETVRARVRDLEQAQKNEPTGRRPILGGATGRSVEGYYGVGSHKTGTPLEDVVAGPKDIAAAIERDKGNPLELEVRQAILRKDDELNDALDRVGGDTGDESFAFGEDLEEAPTGTERYATRKPPAGQRGLFGTEDDVAPAEPPKAKPKQADLFGQGEMLQGTEARVTEGRERDGSLFTQDVARAERADAARQGTLAPEPDPPRAEPARPRPQSIEDVGEKIGGARKDQWRDRGLRMSDLEGMSGGEEAAHVVKANIWRPDYGAMVEAGAQPNAAALVKVIYDKIAAAPREDTTAGRRHYLAMMERVRDAYSGVRTVQDVKAARDKLLADMGWHQGKWRDDETRAQFFSIFKGRREPFATGYDDVRRAEGMVGQGFPNVEPWSRRYMIRASHDGTGGFRVYERGAMKRVGDPVYPTHAAAEAAAKAIYEQRKAEGGGRELPQRPHLDNIERTGEDVRRGRDVQGDDYLDTFGFRGIEFGNWAAQDERQTMVNLGFEALHDLARTLNVPPQALSLNGTMGLAFGARGQGRAAAHYEPGRLVINLTKKSGAGTLAHEWGHALDHYFGELNRADAYKGGARGASGWYQPGGPRLGTVTRTEKGPDGAWRPVEKHRLDNLRPEMRDAWDGVMKAIFKRDQTRAEAVRDAELALEHAQASVKMAEERLASSPSNAQQLRDYIKHVRETVLLREKNLAHARGESWKPRSVNSSYFDEAKSLSGKAAERGYWARPTELLARSFEAYVSDKIAETGQKSQYLVHGVNGVGYPAGIERAAINAAFDDLFRTTRSRQTEKGVALYRAAGDFKPEPIGAEQVQKAFASGKVEQVATGAWDVSLPNGKLIRVRLKPDGIEYQPAAFQKAYGREKSADEKIVGRFTPVKSGGIVWLAKEADQGTVHHEAFHAAMDLVLTPKERDAVLKRYGSEEAAAEAYAAWTPKQVNGWFSKILAFAQRMVRTFRPTWESAFERTRTGEAYGPSASTRTGGDRYATAPAPQPPARGGAQIANAPAPPPATTRQFVLPEEGLTDKFTRHFQDKLIRGKRTIEAVRSQGGRVTSASDFYAKEELFHGRTEERLKDAERRFADPLVKGLANEGVTLKQLDDYMYAKHAPTRNAVIAQRDPSMTDGSGMSDAEAAQILADFQARGLTPKLDRLAQIVRDARDEQVRVLVSGGLLSQQQAAAWRTSMGADYVPLRTVEVDEGIGHGPALGVGQGFDVRGKEARSATGRQSRADSPVTFMLSQLQRAIVRAEKNRVSQSFAEFVKANPDPKLWEMDKTHTRRDLDTQGQVRDVQDFRAYQDDFDYKVNGETKRITIHDPLLLRAMKNLSAHESAGFIQKLGNLTRLYSTLVTSWSPEFILTNPVRDIQAALANVSAEQGGKIAREMVKNIPAAMRGMYQAVRNPRSYGGNRWAQLAHEFRQDGGSVGFYALKDVPALERELQSKVRGTPNWTQKVPGVRAAANTDLSRALFRVTRGFKDWVEDANKAVENGTRLAVYAALRDAGATREKAASVAKNATLNFNRKGEVGPTLNALYAFFNANVQGTKRVYDVVVKTPKGRAIAAGVIGAGAALDLYNRSVAGDSNNDGTNDYDDIPEYVKDRNLVFVRGEGKRPILFPMPYGFNVLHGLGRQIAAASQGAVTPARAAASLAGSLYNAFNPLGAEASLVQVLSPTFLDPVLQHALNRDFADRQIRPEPFPTSPKKPDSEMFFPTAPPLAVVVARALNSASGGDKVTPGLIDVSPETIQHYWDFASGGLGRFGGNVANVATALASGEAPSLRTIPVARRFVHEPSPGQPGQKYRENVEELDALEVRYKTYRREGNREGLRDISGRMLRAKQQVDSIDRRIRELRKHGRDTGRDVDVQLEALYNRANRIVAAARQGGH